MADAKEIRQLSTANGTANHHDIPTCQQDLRVNKNKGIYSKVKTDSPPVTPFQNLEFNEDKLITETHDIQGEFLTLFTKVRHFLESKGVTVRDFVEFLMGVPAYSKRSLFEEQISELNESPDLYGVFKTVKDYCSWFNHFLLGLIIDIYCKDNKELLQAYKKYRAHLRRYCKVRVMKFAHKNGFGYGGKKDKIMILKVDRKWEEIRIEQLEEVVFNVAQILNVTRCALHLCSVENGCVQLTLLVPSYIPGEVFPLTTEREKAMKKMGVSKLQCENYCFRCQVHEYFMYSVIIVFHISPASFALPHLSLLPSKP